MSNAAGYRYLLLTALAAAAATAMGKEIECNQRDCVYWQDQRGYVVMDPYGLCWRTSRWSPQLAAKDGPNGAGCACDKAALPKEVCEPPPPPPAPVPFVEKLTFGSDALFEFDRAELKPGARDKLDRLAEKIQGAAIQIIHIVGYTDSVGTDAYNDKLSERRAVSVRDYLVSRGVNSSVMDTQGRGKRDPVASNATKEGRSQNRRVEVVVEGSRTIMTQ